MAKKLSTEEFIKLCNEVREDMHEYMLLDEYKNNSTKIRFKHLLCGDIFEMIPSNFKFYKYQCPKCAGNKRMDTSSFSNRVNILGNGEYILKSNYINNSTKVDILHKSCNNIYSVLPSDFSNGYRCPYCAGNKKLTLSDIKNKITEIDNNYSLVDLDYNNFKNVHSKLIIYHNECESSFEMNFNNFRNGQRCKACNKKRNESRAITKIKKYLNDNNIKFLEEVKLEGLKDIRDLRVDIYLSDLDVYIEYDGKQHFEYSANGIFTKDVFENIRRRDKIKDDFFNNQDIVLYRINYKEDPIRRIEEIISSTTIEKISDDIT